MKIYSFIYSILAMSILLIASACNRSDIIDDLSDETVELHTASLTMNGGVCAFDSSRADSNDWENGDCIYLRFTTANGIVTGKAVYDNETGYWTVTYNGNLTEEVGAKCETYFFRNAISESDGNVVFDKNTIVYADREASYIFKDGVVFFNANLFPQTARFRFEGEPGTSFIVSGHCYYTSYNIASNTFEQTVGEETTKIGDNGYSPYIYGFFDEDNQSIIVSKDDGTFKRSINTTNYAVGKTGYLSLPNTSSYTGWSIFNDLAITVNGVTFKMILVEAGTFTMGATSEQTGADYDEKPAHQVTLTKDFHIGETEVTQALWYAVIGQKPTTDSDFQWTKDIGLGSNYPAYYLSWNDCQEFITKLSQLTGFTFRLPTEAEWEFAARGGNKATTQTLYSGSNTIDNVAWYLDNSSSSTHTVAGKAANALGLYDMSGNVWEWCNDLFGYPYSSGPQTDPTTSPPTDESWVVWRGGSWNGYATECRVASRSFGVVRPYRYNSVGMRLAL